MGCDVYGWDAIVIIKPMLFRHRNVKEILATRRDSTRRMVMERVRATSRADDWSEGRLDFMLRKGELTNEDKAELLRYIEKKYRLYFNQNFYLSMLREVRTEGRKVIDRNFNSERKSWFMLRGKLLMSGTERRQSEEAINPESMTDSQDGHCWTEEKCVKLEGEIGIGEVFREEQWIKCRLMAEDAVLL